MEAVTAEVQEIKSSGVREKLAAYFELTKPRIAFLLILTSAAGFYLGSENKFDISLFVNTILGITLLAFGVATLNQYLERETDALMTRTAKRPLVIGVISPNEALIFGVLQCAVAEIYLTFLVNGLTAALGLFVIIGYVLLYTPLKTRTSASTAVGAFPGALPPLMGWTAASNHISLGALVLFAILFFWQFPHFMAIAWLYREEYGKAGIKMLPVVEPEGRSTMRQIIVFTFLLFPISIAPFFISLAGWIYLLGACVLGIWFLYAGIQTARLKTNESARKLLIASVIYLPLIFLLMVFNKI